MDKNLVIAGRDDLSEEYLARLIDNSLPGVNPLVCVILILRYPIQHAIYWPDVANENPPIPAGCVCRLPFLRTATPEEAGLFEEHGPNGTCDAPMPDMAKAVARTPEADVRRYCESLEAAQRAAMAEAKTDEERAIIRRHMTNGYGPRRSLQTYAPWELAQYLKYRRALK